jgi:hypothetical protein
MDIVLKTNAEDPALAFENVQRFANESGFGCQLAVRSYGFSAKAPFSFERDAFDLFRAGLKSMDHSLKGTARLQPGYEDSYVEFMMGSTGAVFVSGEIGRHAEFSQLLRFEFRTDQTCLRPLVWDLDACTKLTPV